MFDAAPHHADEGERACAILPWEIRAAIVEIVFWDARRPPPLPLYADPPAREADAPRFPRRRRRRAAGVGSEQVPPHVDPAVREEKRIHAARRRVVRAGVGELLSLAATCRAWREAVLGERTPFLRLWRASLLQAMGLAGSPRETPPPGSLAARRQARSLAHVGSLGAAAVIARVMRYMAGFSLCEWFPRPDHLLVRASAAAARGDLHEGMFARYRIDVACLLRLCEVHASEEVVRFGALARERIGAYALVDGVCAFWSGVGASIPPCFTSELSPRLLPHESARLTELLVQRRQLETRLRRMTPRRRSRSPAEGPGSGAPASGHTPAAPTKRARKRRRMEPPAGGERSEVAARDGGAAASGSSPGGGAGEAGDPGTDGRERKRAGGEGDSLPADENETGDGDGDCDRESDEDDADDEDWTAGPRWRAPNVEPLSEDTLRERRSRRC